MQPGRRAIHWQPGPGGLYRKRREGRGPVRRDRPIQLHHSEPALPEDQRRLERTATIERRGNRDEQPLYRVSRAGGAAARTGWGNGGDYSEKFLQRTVFQA